MSQTKDGREHNDIRSHWEQVYERKSFDGVSWYQRTPHISLELIKQAGISPEAAIIDVGGGASLLVDRLLDMSYRNLHVLDIAASALQVAQDRLGEKKHRVQWHVGDITKYELKESYDLWHDRAAFHFLTQGSQRKDYVENLKRALKPNGQLIMGSFAKDGPSRCSNLDIVQYDASSLLHALGDGFEIKEQRREAHQTPGGHIQYFAWFRLQRTGN